MNGARAVSAAATSARRPADGPHAHQVDERDRGGAGQQRRRAQQLGVSSMRVVSHESTKNSGGVISASVWTVEITPQRPLVSRIQ